MTSLANRLRFPDDRTTFIYQGAFQPILTPPITTIVVYADQAATTLADIVDTSGNPIPGSLVRTDATGLVPEFYGPTTNVTRVWALVPGTNGVTSPLDAQTAGLLTALGGGGTVTQVAGVNPDAEGHVALTATNVGADTAGAAATAQATAETFATNAVSVEQARAEAAEATLYTKPSGGIPVTDLSSTAQTDLSLGASAYQKPGGGIPATDLSASVQTSLGLANTALQAAPITSFNGRGGAVVPTTGDYTAAQVGADASGAAATAQTNAQTFATNAVGAETTRAEGAEALLAPLASPALTGTPTAPTKAALTNTTAIATTAYTDAAVGVETTRAEGAEATLTTSVSAKYTKPGTGIPSTDMTSAVQTSLGLANTALQPGQGGTGTVTSVTAGDGTITIGGTAAAPTVRATTGTSSGTVAAGNDSRITGAAPLASPAFTGTPSAPTDRKSVV